MKIKHNLFFEMTADLLCIANNEGYFVDVNQNFVETLGYSKEEFLSRPYQTFIHPDDIEKTQPQVTRSRSGQDILNFTNRYRHNDGHYVYLSWTARTNPDDSLIYAIARDVSAEVEARNYAYQLDKAINESSIVVETDTDGVITQVNDEFCRISGYRRDELIGKTHRIVNSGFHNSRFFEQLWKKISSGNVWTGTIKNKRKDGSFYFVKTMIVPIFNSEGDITKYVAIRQDITDSLETSSALTKANKILNG